MSHIIFDNANILQKICANKCLNFKGGSSILNGYKVIWLTCHKLTHSLYLFHMMPFH